MAGYRFLVSAATVLLLVISTRGQSDHDGGTERFPSFESVRIRASRLSTPSDFTTHTEQRQAVFPSLKFKCSGKIEMIWFIGRVNNILRSAQSLPPLPPPPPLPPAFQLFRRTPLQGSVYTQNQTTDSAAGTDVATSSEEVRLFSITLSNPLTYQKDDIFGSQIVNSGVDLLHLRNLGQAAYYIDGHKFSPSMITNRHSNSSDYPLIAIETNRAHCTEGFLSLAVIETLVAKVVPYPNQLRIFPQLNFPCEGTVEGFTIGGKGGLGSVANKDQQPLEIGLWSCIEVGRCNNMTLVSVQQPLPLHEGLPNVYTYEFPSGRKWHVNTTSVISIGQRAVTDNSLALYYQQGVGFASYITSDSDTRLQSFVTPLQSMQLNLPLLYPMYTPDQRFTGSDESSSCNTNFIEPDKLKERALLIERIQTQPPLNPRKRRETIASNGIQYLFRHLSFQKSGLLTRLIFAASKMDPVNGNGLYPQFQLWRPNDRRQMVLANLVYERVNTTDLTKGPITTPGELNVYEYNIQSNPVEYFSGDIIGIYQPPPELSALRIAFVNDESVTMLPTGVRIAVEYNQGTSLVYNLSATAFVSLGKYLPVLSVETAPLTTQSPMTTSVPTHSEPTKPTRPIVSTTIDRTGMSPKPEPKSTATPEVTEGTTIFSSEETEIESTVATPGSLSIIGVAGAGVGGVVVFLLLLVIVVVLCIFVVSYRRKVRSSHLTCSDAEGNPYYSQATVPVNNGAQLYEVPLTSINTVHGGQQNSVIYQTVGEVPQQYETPSVTRAAANLQVPNDVNPYHVLEATNVEGHIEQGSGHTYQTLEATKQYSSEPAEKGEEFEMDVIVPTEEQRATVRRTKNRDVYVSLRATQSQTSSMKSEDGSYFVESEVYWTPASSPGAIYQQLSSRKYREIPRSTIQVTDHLGSGNFGTVNKGLWQTLEGSKPVAVKKLKGDASDIDKVKFLQEAAVNGQFRHPNVVKLLGVVTVGEPVMIVLEFMENGDLKNYLQKIRPVPGEMVSSDWPQMLLSFCQHTAAGMDYLSKKGFVHRDLAARNILVSGNKICKVTDFGMSREIEEESYYVSTGGLVPVKWTAPEAINYKKFSTASDVWSFGCVMYEIWSIGRKPFPKNSNSESVKLTEEGYRLPPPPGCPREIYRVMIQCWHPEAGDRPGFAQLLDTLLRPESILLSWDEDRGVVERKPEVAILGSSLKHSKYLYTDLQNSYKSLYEIPSILNSKS